jgi:uncharacterized protein YcfL
MKRGFYMYKKIIISAILLFFVTGCGSNNNGITYSNQVEITKTLSSDEFSDNGIVQRDISIPINTENGLSSSINIQKGTKFKDANGNIVTSPYQCLEVKKIIILKMR